MRHIAIAAILGLLAGPAHAQILLNDDARRMTQDEYLKQQALDDKYKSATQKIPDQKATVDPWGNVRASDSKPAAKQKSPR
jgi:hypothetical protein